MGSQLEGAREISGEPDLELRRSSRVSGVEFNPHCEDAIGNDRLADVVKDGLVFNQVAAIVEPEIVRPQSLVDSFEGIFTTRIGKQIDIVENYEGSDRMPKQTTAHRNFAYRMVTPKTEDGKHEFDLIKAGEPVNVEIHDLRFVNETSDIQLQAYTRLLKAAGLQIADPNHSLPSLFPIVTPAKKK